MKFSETCCSSKCNNFLLILQNDAKNDTKRSRKIVTSKSVIIEFQIPKEFISVVIGRGGSVINDIQSKTGTYVKMQDDVQFPHLPYKCIIKGDNIESVRLAESLIKNIIDNRPIIETYELFVPQETCWRILKKNVVQMIQRTTGVKIIIDKGPYISESMY